MPEKTIRIYKHKDEAGHIVGWSGDIKIPGYIMWINVRERSMPTDYDGSIYPTKDAAIEAAKRTMQLTLHQLKASVSFLSQTHILVSAVSSCRSALAL
ncbi:MAG: hypothetical protein WBX25_15395 [Rhodomicrobium sp.]